MPKDNQLLEKCCIIHRYPPGHLSIETYRRRVITVHDNVGYMKLGRKDIARNRKENKNTAIKSGYHITPQAPKPSPTRC